MFVAGALVATVAMMAVAQKRAAHLNGQKNALSAELSAKNREAELLHKQVEENRAMYEKRLEEQQIQAEKRLEEANRRNEREKAEQTELLDKQFNDRLRLLQEQLKTATEQLLKQRSDELGQANRSQMDSIISPLKAVMTEMRKSLDENRESFTRSTASLGEQLKLMHATTESLGAEAERLSKALQAGPKVQGDFGELKLNDILDKIGLTKGVEYDVQYTMKDEKGNYLRNDDTNDKMRPDIVLHYPDHKDVIIDSKTSLTAFVNYVNAESDEERQTSLKEHVRSVRKHVDELAAKDYGKYSIEGRSTLDFVIMFVPQEAAMQLAVSADATLWSYAFDRKVFITGEQNLFSLLRLLQIAWNQQRQAENQERVFGLANTLVDRVGLFVERFSKVGRGMESLQKAFDEADKSLRGNQSFVVSARKLVEMGAKENHRRPLPDIEETMTERLETHDDGDE